jgi:triosephosphate isomerase (TIM)
MKLLIGGNWKMNATMENIKIFENLHFETPNNIDIFIAVPCIYIEECSKVFPKTIKIAAQDISTHEKGSFTGEISATYLKEFNVEYVIVGHSERRIYQNESDEDVNKKIKLAIKNKIRPVLCIGESIETRRHGQHIDFLYSQFRNSCKDLQNSSFDIAYEPIWSVGTGKIPENSQISEVILQIKVWMNKNDIEGRVIYGGSVSQENIDELKKIESLDGFLIGNSSLDQNFINIIENFANNQ